MSDVNDPTESAPSELPRRDFLRLAGLGTGALLSGVAPLALDAQQQQPQPYPVRTGRGRARASSHVVVVGAGADHDDVARGAGATAAGADRVRLRLLLLGVERERRDAGEEGAGAEAGETEEVAPREFRGRRFGGVVDVGHSGGRWAWGMARRSLSCRAAAIAPTVNVPRLARVDD